jgi:hypothetical protein
MTTAQVVSAPVPVIWSACQTGDWEEDYLHQVIDRAAAEGASGLELSGRYVDALVEYRDFPALQRAVDPRAATRRQALQRVCQHAARRGLALGVWHHEVNWPHAARGHLLDLLPPLRAPDGLLDLDSPLLYRLITSRVSEFLDLFPTISQIVLTLTETAYPVMHRPFCAIHPVERIRRVLQAVADATESRQRTLVVRPFSALRDDERHVVQAIQQIKAQRLELMYKTEPADWHPFLPDDEAIGSIRGIPCRAETDAGAEYYGQTLVPCCFTTHLERRMRAALARGAGTAVLRVDRGCPRTALDTPINEANLIAIHRWLRDPSRSRSEHLRQWMRQRHGDASEELESLFEQTFDVIKQSLYIDGHCLTHCHGPSLTNGKHVQTCLVLEPEVPLDHLAENWGVRSERTSPSHERVLAEKDEALGMARALRQRFESIGVHMTSDSRQAIAAALDRLVLLAEVTRSWCRLVVAHLREIWRLPGLAGLSFDAEVQLALSLAARIEQLLGPGFFANLKGDQGEGLAEELRKTAVGLVAERALEIPLRATLNRDETVRDYVLCGLASEGHRLRKRLHSGDTPRLGDRFVRRSGLGADEGFGYHLQGQPGPATLHLTLLGGPLRGSGRVEAEAQAMDFAVEPEREQEVAMPLRLAGDGGLRVEVWATGTQPVSVHRMILRQEAKPGAQGSLPRGYEVESRTRESTA